MIKQTNSFAEAIKSISGAHDLKNLFFDFIELIFQASSRAPLTGIVYDLAQTKEIMQKYPGAAQTQVFSMLDIRLQLDYEIRKRQNTNTDILGEFLENEFPDDDYFLMPWPVCKQVAYGAAILNTVGARITSRMKIFDPHCGTGRMLIANAILNGKKHTFYGVEDNPVYAKIAIYNLFVNAVDKAEVLLLNEKEEFVLSYSLSESPRTIHTNHDKETSALWRYFCQIYGKSSK